MAITGIEMYVNYINAVSNKANYYSGNKVNTNTNIVSIINLASDIDDLSDLDKLYRIATGQSIFFSSLDFIPSINVDDYVSRIGNIIEDEHLKELMLTNCGSLLSDSVTIPMSDSFSELINFDDSISDVSDEINNVKDDLTGSFDTLLSSMDNDEEDVYYDDIESEWGIDEAFEEPDFSSTEDIPKWDLESDDEDDEDDENYYDEYEENDEEFVEKWDLEDDEDEDETYIEDGEIPVESEDIPKWDLDDYEDDELEDDYLDENEKDGYIKENHDNLTELYYNNADVTLDYEDIMADGLFSDVVEIPKWELESEDDEEEDDEYYDIPDDTSEPKTYKWDLDDDEDEEEYLDESDFDGSDTDLPKWDLDDDEDDEDEYIEDGEITKSSKDLDWDLDFETEEYEPEDDEYLSESDFDLDDESDDENLFDISDNSDLNWSDEDFKDKFSNSTDVNLYSSSKGNTDSFNRFGGTNSDDKSSEDKLADTILTISKKIEESPTFLKNLFKSAKITDEDLDCID